MSRSLPPTRREIEALEHDLYKRGDITSVARLEGVDPSYLSKQLNPDEVDHKGVFFPFVLRLRHCVMGTADVGDGYMALLSQFLNEWRGTREPERGEVVQLARAVNGSMFDLLQAQVTSLPYAEQMAYIDKAMMLLDQFKRDLQLNDIEDSPVPNIRGKRA